MKVRILRQSTRHVHGIALKYYRPGQVYDVPATLAAYLVTEGLGMVEMRSDASPPRSVTPDRRRNGPFRGES